MFPFLTRNVKNSNINEPNMGLGVTFVFLKLNYFNVFSFRPYAFGPRQDEDDDDNLCPVEAARDEGESFNELEHILELESVPKDLMVLQRKR